MRPLLYVIALAALAAAPACRRGDPNGPPSLRLGRDECGECGMTIHDERCAGALLVERGGRRDYLLFDDLGCMLDADGAAGADVTVLARFVSDHAAGAWVTADVATFLATDGVHTPMGSGMIAFAHGAAAAEAKQRFGGRIMDYATLGAHRRVWKETREGASGG